VITAIAVVEVLKGLPRIYVVDDQGRLWWGLHAVDGAVPIWEEIPGPPNPDIDAPRTGAGL
jgi:hypothetical protein